MAHFALIKDNVVQNVIVADSLEWVQQYLPGEWVQTSFNTRRGIHYGADLLPDGGVALRKNFASIGSTYDSARDAFIPPKVFNSWVFNEDACDWDPPTPMPSGLYYWDEPTTSWKSREHKAADTPAAPGQVSSELPA